MYIDKSQIIAWKLYQILLYGFHFLGHDFKSHSQCMFVASQLDNFLLVVFLWKNCRGSLQLVHFIQTGAINSQLLNYALSWQEKRYFLYRRKDYTLISTTKKKMEKNKPQIPFALSRHSLFNSKI